jgi:2-methylisocitrate lyase-like PEP mutase family enzyme
MPFECLLDTVKRIIPRVRIPLSVELEQGYSKELRAILEHIEKLHDLGVAGINIEDSDGPHAISLRSITDFQKLISGINSHLDRKNMKNFINARTDAYLIKHPAPLEETVQRANAYEQAGANGIFVPFLNDPIDIRRIVRATRLPVNVFCTPRLPSFKVLSGLGVKRISMGAALFQSMKSSLEKTISGIREDKSFLRLF